MFVFYPYNQIGVVEKMILVYPYMRGGKAGPWAEYHSQELLNAYSGRPTNGVVPRDWTELRQRIIDRFGDKYLVENTRKKLEAGKQGARLIKDYTLEMSNWAAVRNAWFNPTNSKSTATYPKVSRASHVI